MAIKVKRQEVQLEQELAEKLKEFGLEIELPIEDEEEEIEETETDDE